MDFEEFKDKIENSENDKEANRLLIERYPFLIPRNMWSGEIVPDYDYTYTKLDSLGKVWKDDFGLDLCEELTEALGDNVKDYRPTQIKEKYGELRWYDFGNTREGMKVIDKYADRSREICYRCGKPATHYTTGWISYVCEEHAEESGNAKELE